MSTIKNNEVAEPKLTSEDALESLSADERKRSLDEDSEDDDEDKGFKRQALNNGAEDKPTAMSGVVENGDVDANGEYQDQAKLQQDQQQQQQQQQVSNKSTSMRAIISTKEASIIIGKQGKNVADIRDQSGAKVTVSENVSGCYERIVTMYVLLL
jgi:heterogeneous nuclear rnp K-like protein